MQAIVHRTCIPRATIPITPGSIPGRTRISCDGEGDSAVTAQVSSRRSGFLLHFIHVTSPNIVYRASNAVLGARLSVQYLIFGKHACSRACRCCPMVLHLFYTILPESASFCFLNDINWLLASELQLVTFLQNLVKLTCKIGHVSK